MTRNGFRKVEKNCASSCHYQLICQVLTTFLDSKLGIKFSERNSSTISFIPDTVANSIGQFPYNPEEGVTLHHISGDMRTWKDEKKALRLLRKLSPAKFEKYCNYILPKKSQEHSF